MSSTRISSGAGSRKTLDLFDRLILSYEVGHMKPSEEFYRACVTAADVPASSCVFIDDMIENVEGARRAGLEAIQFVDTPSSDRRATALRSRGPAD